MADIPGTTGDDTLTGTVDADTISGLEGNDVIDGLGGADQMDGGAGDDLIFVDDPGDVILEAAGGGYDNVAARASYLLTAGAHVEVLSTADNGGTAAINLTGNALGQVIVGNAGANVIDGAGGADRLAGLGGNDTLIVDSADDFVDEAAGGGFDYVIARVSYALTAGSHIELMSTDNNSGTAAINLTGNALGQVIVGNAGANVIDGAGGADRLAGLGGNDTLIVDSADDFVDEGVGGGFDYVVARTSYTLTVGAEIELMSTDNNSGTGAINLTGNALGQVIVGNAGANVIDGAGGTDRLAGLGGNDVLIVDSADDFVDEAAGGGFDYVIARVSYALTPGASIELLSTDNNNGTAAINLTGNALGQVIVGNAGANVIDGAGGTDRLAGLGGNDTLIVDSADDFIDEAAGGGYDYVIARVSYVLTAGASVELLSTADNGGTAAINLTGNELANIIVGNAGANILDGGGAADRLVGLGGADSFAFTTAPVGGNIDIIVDFDADDTILLGGASGQPFAALASGALRAGTFVTGGAAVDADDYLLYNSGTGALMYDADGNGAGVAVQFATLGTGLTLTAADFIVSGLANNAPTISSSGTVSVAENTAAATVVYQVAANDGDGDTITYSLSGTDAALLNIDAATGAVRLNDPANFEAKASYSFNVVASDSGSATTRAVVLTITDLPEGPQTPIVQETSAANDSIGTAQAIPVASMAIADNPNLADPSLPSIIVQGGISSSSDKDFFAITLAAGQLLILDVDNSGGELDTYLRLYKPSGNNNEIAANDDLGVVDPGSPAHPTYGHNTDSFLHFRAPRAGTYYFSIESFQDPEHPTSGSYELNISVGPPIPAAQMFAEDVAALLSGEEWNHPNLSYGFPTQASQYPTAFEEIDQPGEFQAFSGLQQSVTGQLLQMIATVSGLTFTQNGAAPGQADLRFAMTSDTGAAHAYYPTNAGPGSPGGTAWFNKSDFNSPTRGNYAWTAMLHEIGHALGLKHGHEDPAVNAIHDTLEYTVMTYRSHVFSPVDEDSGYTNEQWGYPQTLMMLDIAALQELYGPNFAYNPGDTVYSWSPTTGEMSINGGGQGAPGANRIFMTLWDGGGNDTYDFSNYTTPGVSVTIDLRPGEWTRVSGTQTANLGNGEFAAGNIANALLYHGDPRSLIENAIGSSGFDQIYANQAKNTLTGNGGTDQFHWRSVADAGLGATADVVTDFLRDPEHLDLSEIDAVSGTPSNDEFSFIGFNAFSGIAGQLRLQAVGNDIHVLGDVNGDSVADFEIIVNNQPLLFHSDFIL